MALVTQVRTLNKTDGWVLLTPGGCTAFTVTLPANGQLLVWPAESGQQPANTVTSGHLIARGIVGVNSEISGAGLPPGSEIYARVPDANASAKLGITVTFW